MSPTAAAVIAGAGLLVVAYECGRIRPVHTVREAVWRGYYFGARTRPKAVALCVCFPGLFVRALWQRHGPGKPATRKGADPTLSPRWRTEEDQ